MYAFTGGLFNQPSVETYILSARNVNIFVRHFLVGNKIAVIP